MNRPRVLVRSAHPHWALALRTVGFDAFEDLAGDGFPDVAFIDDVDGSTLVLGDQPMPDYPVVLLTDSDLVVPTPNVSVVRSPLSVPRLAELLREAASVPPPEAPGSPAVEEARPGPAKGSRKPREKTALADPASQLESLVRALRDTVTSPADVLTHLAERLAQVAMCAVALMVSQDERSAAVVEGIGLRNTEWRPVQPLPQALTWLSRRTPVLAVPDSDAMRGSLIGLPLAYCRSVLLARAPSGLLVVAGRDEPFTPADVARLTAVVRDHDQGVEQALRLEAASRELAEWIDSTGASEAF